MTIKELKNKLEQYSDNQIVKVRTIEDWGYSYPSWKFVESDNFVPTVYIEIQ